MDDNPIRVLLVEDDQDDYLLTRERLADVYGGRLHLDWESDYDVAQEAIGRRRHDVYLIDYRLGGRSGLDLLREAVGRGGTAPIILLTGQGDREIDVEAMRIGAADYLVKGQITADLLERSIRYAIERKRTEEALRRARGELERRVRERTAELARANEELRERIEELNQAKEAAESANRAKDTFLGVVSHELRTPLTPVLIAATALLDREHLDPDLRELLRMIEQNLVVEARLIDDLLDVTRIGHGKMAYQFEVVDLHDVIERSLKDHGSRLEDGGLTLLKDLSALNPLVRGDAYRLQQVLRNLIDNALKFTPAGGRVSITTCNEGSRLVVKIRDNGIGIDGETLPKLFQAFVQGERTIIRRFGGLGLGLAISKSIVEAHGGRLVAHSEGMGRGAEFKLDLETVPKWTDTEASQGAARSGGGEDRLRIFFIEDDPVTRRVFLKMLHMFGYDVRHADTYREALALADGEFDLVLSDIALPDGSGWDVMRYIRSRWGHIPGIALSGFGSEEDVSTSRAAGFAIHLTKPIQFQELRATIEMVARQRSRG